ncbi:SIS domain-containing protein [Pectinatus cerevisiiphilus]|uniref:Arabinose-5-phosphate isomerase n=1 Tax=Pectinatus cerevisiiphilus TaxID=86956 RepID=A0A4R3KF32_9FIRM|nr:SIS domain-containing protein [Pectinatus cerevisiiphilus]TCS81964.1 arabinose-5-phosphate isomerase [Pectinatus cerevisiiphilus]
MQSNEYDNLNMLNKYLNTSMNELQRFVDKLNKDGLQKALQLILKAECNHHRIHVTGIGKPAHVAGYIASLFSSIGTPTYELSGIEAVHGSSGQVMPGDVVIAISNSGETKELQYTVQTLKNNGAQIIAVTGNPSSWLATESEICLFAGVNYEGDSLNKPPRTSILAEIILLQCLSVMLQQAKNLTIDTYVKWHPGGAIGKSINETKVRV